MRGSLKLNMEHVIDTDLRRMSHFNPSVSMGMAVSAATREFDHFNRAIAEHAGPVELARGEHLTMDGILRAQSLFKQGLDKVRKSCREHVKGGCPLSIREQKRLQFHTSRQIDWIRADLAYAA